MARVCLANELGPEVCWLLTVIANTEDAKGYRDAVTFFNDQLIGISGFGSVPSLNRFRTKAVEAGWLHYEPGVRRKAGRYWVVIPDRFDDVKNGPIDHDEADYRDGFPSTNGRKAEGNRRESVQESVGKAEGNRRETVHPSSLTLTLTQEDPPPNPPSGGADVEPPTSDAAKAKAKQEQRAREREAREAKKRAEAEAVAALPIPRELETPDFRDAWARWQRHRAKKHPLTVDGAATTLKQLAARGAAEAVRRIDLSIANGWRGLIFPDERHGRPPPRGRPANRDEYIQDQIEDAIRNP
jgi:hypothetical protein